MCILLKRRIDLKDPFFFALEKKISKMKKLKNREDGENLIIKDLW
jgi:hypothetical protein